MHKAYDCPFSQLADTSQHEPEVEFRFLIAIIVDSPSEFREKGQSVFFGFRYSVWKSFTPATSDMSGFRTTYFILCWCGKRLNLDGFGRLKTKLVCRLAGLGTKGKGTVSVPYS